MFLFLCLTSLFCGFLLLFWHVADPGKSVMSARFRLPAGRSYNVRATELERDRQHTQVVCNVLLLDNTVQAFKVSVSTHFQVEQPDKRKAPSDSSNQRCQQRRTHLWTSGYTFDGINGVLICPLWSFYYLESGVCFLYHISQGLNHSWSTRQLLIAEPSHPPSHIIDLSTIIIDL